MELPTSAEELFERTPEEFTAARDLLVRQLKQDGDTAAAADVKKLKRPSVAAYALNLIARRHGYLVDRLLEADERLRTATSRPAMDAAKDDRRQAIAAIVSQAVALLGEQERPVTAQVRERLTQTLLAIGTDPATRADLQRGILVKEAAPGSFGGPVPVFEPVSQGAEEEAGPQVEQLIQALRKEAEAQLAEAETMRKRAEQAEQESEDLAAASAAARERSEHLTKQADDAEHEGRSKLAEAGELERK